MIAIVGTVDFNSVAVGGAKVQVLIRDTPNSLLIESDVVVTSADGKFQLSLWGDLKLHEGLSNEAEVIVLAWEDGETRLDSHTKMISKTIIYDGSELILADVTLKEKYNDLVLDNGSIEVVVGQPFVYTPVFSHVDQSSFEISKTIFPEQAINTVEFSEGSFDEWSHIYNVVKQETVSVTITQFNGLQKTFDITVDVVEDDTVIEELVDIDITSGMAFFVGSDKGIKNNGLEVFMTFSDRITPTEVRFYSDDSLLATINDFASTTATIGVPSPAVGTHSVIRMETDATFIDNSGSVSLSYEQEMVHYSHIVGDVVVSLDPETGKHTALYTFDHVDEIVSVLWQIVYKSVIIEKVIDVSGSEEKGFINILYQDYVTPANNTIEFETLQPGNYVVHAYAINHAGRFFDASENLFVPGGTQGDDDDLVVGDSVPIGCLSTHGEVPILEVFRLTRENGWEVVESIPMGHAYDRTYFVDYVLDVDNAYYIFKATDTMIVKRVGDLAGVFLAYPKNLGIGRTVPYTLEDFSGNMIADGNLDDSGIGAYYKIVSENVAGVLVVSGTRKIV